MLCTTYVLTTIYLEQRTARDKLQRLHTDTLSCLEQQPACGLGQLDALLESVFGFDSEFRARKIDAHVIPALSARKSGQAFLLGKLLQLKESAASALRASCEQMDTLLGDMSVEDIVLSLSHYCDLILETLDKEAEELLPLLPSLLRDEDWFSIAARLSRSVPGRMRAETSHSPACPVPRPAPLMQAEARAA
jgi:hypothetical protein